VALLALSDDTLVTLHRSRKIRWWNGATAECLRTEAVPGDRPLHRALTAIDPERQHLALLESLPTPRGSRTLFRPHLVHVLGLAGSQDPVSHQLSSLQLNAMGFAAGGQRLALCGTSSALIVLDIQTGSIQNIGGGRGLAQGAVLWLHQPKPRVVYGDSNGNLHVWDLVTLQRLHVLSGHEGSVTALVLDPNGRHLYSASHDQTIRLWDLDTGTSLRALGTSRPMKPRLDDKVPSPALALHPDGTHIAHAFDRYIDLWDLASGQKVQVLEGHSSYIRALAFHPRGAWLVSAGADRTLRFWDTRQGTALASWSHTASVDAVKVVPPSTVVTLDSEGSLRFLQPTFSTGG
jgi:WD40 repeat protein